MLRYMYIACIVISKYEFQKSENWYLASVSFWRFTILSTLNERNQIFGNAHPTLYVTTLH
jgi:hypothetical protein